MRQSRRNLAATALAAVSFAAAGTALAQAPAKGTHASLFIDVIGMPLTPMSYAGVARRSYRRAVMW